MLSAECVAELLSELKLSPAECEEARTLLWLLAGIACDVRRDRLRARALETEPEAAVAQPPPLTNQDYEKQENHQEGEVQ